MRFAPSVALLALTSGLAAADIHLKEGGVLSGEIRERRDDGSVVLELHYSDGGKGLMTLPASRIVKIDGEEMLSEQRELGGRALAGEPAGRYAVLIISGRVGEGIDAQSLESGLYAIHQAKVPRAVLIVDSDGTGDLAEARRLARMLTRWREVLRLHVVIKRCQGPALVLPALAHSVHMMPGAVMGGLPPASDTAEDAIQRTALAEELAQMAAASGRSPAIARAMVDPGRPVFLWRSDEGLEAADRLPAGLPADRVLLKHLPGKPFTLEADLLAKAGATLIAAPRELGAVLGLSAWQDVGDAPTQAYRQAVLAQTQERQRGDRVEQRRLQQAVARRDAAESALRNALSQAEAWDPAKGDYATMRVGGWSDGYVVGRRVAVDYSSEGTDTQAFTKDSRREWQQRSDACVAYLDKALQALTELRRAEDAAARAGIDRRSSEAQLQQVGERAQAHRNFVASNRNRRGR
jgi:hypothetical protein